jgi:hypothetical protein
VDYLNHREHRDLILLFTTKFKKYTKVLDRITGFNTDFLNHEETGLAGQAGLGIGRSWGLVRIVREHNTAGIFSVVKEFFYRACPIP